jgi:hypothetical protein
MGGRRIGALLVAAALLAGCGGHKEARTTSTSPRTAASAPPRRPTPGPQYSPSTHHSHRPPGSIYPDEVGENILGAPYRRVIELFGQPAHRHGSCIDYRIVRSPHENWEFCFKGQKMDSAMVVPA